MPRFGAIEMVALNLRIPRGIDGYWRLMLQADKAGPWTIETLVRQTNVTTRSLSQYVDRLRKGGIVEKIAELPPSAKGRKPAAVYRLAQRPYLAPRLDRNGQVLPETLQQTLWRTIKIVKLFTPRELAGEVSFARDEDVDLGAVRFYVGALTSAGILAVSRHVKSRQEAQYRLVKLLGARAPQVLAARVIFDPNSNAVIGTAEAREVSR